MRTLVLAFAGLLGACHLSRPPQDNFTVHAGSSGIRPLVAALERSHGTTATVRQLNIPDSDPTEIFSIDGRDAFITVAAVADDRCNPNAPMHLTYKQGEYRVDLVYETNAPAKRLAAKQLLLKSTSEAGLAAVPFEEC